MKEQAAGVCQTCPGGLPGVCSASTFQLELDPRCWEPLGCTQSVTRSWNKRGTFKAAFPHMGLPWGPNMTPLELPGQERNLQGSSSPRDCPGDKVMGLETNLQGSSSPRGCPGDKVMGLETNLQGSSSPRGHPRGPVCPFLPSVLLLLGFLLTFRNDNI